jgi:hypothetical protein
MNPTVKSDNPISTFKARSYEHMAEVLAESRRQAEAEEMKTRASWVIFDSDGKGQIGRCTRCGDILKLELPMNLKAAVLYMRAFVADHLYCTEA